MPSDDTSDDTAAKGNRVRAAQKRARSAIPEKSRIGTSPRAAVPWRGAGCRDAVPDCSDHRFSAGSGVLQMTSSSLTKPLHDQVRSAFAQAQDRLKAAQAAEQSDEEGRVGPGLNRRPTSNASSSHVCTVEPWRNHTTSSFAQASAQIRAAQEEDSSDDEQPLGRDNKRPRTPPRAMSVFGPSRPLSFTPSPSPMVGGSVQHDFTYWGYVANEERIASSSSTHPERSIV